MGPFISQATQMLANATNQFIHSTGFKYLVVTNAKREALLISRSPIPYPKGTLDIELYAKLATAEDPQMPMIIEHLTTDEEYLQSVEYVKKRLSI